MDKKALEGLDARTESTKVPEEDLMEVDVEVDEEADPPSENETQMSSKRSQSKPEHARGPGRKAKQAKRALVHTGIMTQEEADRLPVEELMEMMTKYRKGNSMLSEFMLQQLAENQKEDLLGRLFTEHMEAPDEVAGDHRGAGPPCQPGAARHHGEVPLLQEGVGRGACEQQESPDLHEGAPAEPLHARPRLRDDQRGGQMNPKPQTLNPKPFLGVTPS